MSWNGISHLKTVFYGGIMYNLVRLQSKVYIQCHFFLNFRAKSLKFVVLL